MIDDDHYSSQFTNFKVECLNKTIAPISLGQMNLWFNEVLMSCPAVTYQMANWHTNSRKLLQCICFYW